MVRTEWQHLQVGPGEAGEDLVLNVPDLNAGVLCLNQLTILVLKLNESHTVTSLEPPMICWHDAS